MSGEGLTGELSACACHGVEGKSMLEFLHDPGTLLSMLECIQTHPKFALSMRLWNIPLGTVSWHIRDDAACVCWAFPHAHAALFSSLV